MSGDLRNGSVWIGAKEDWTGIQVNGRQGRKLSMLDLKDFATIGVYEGGPFGPWMMAGMATDRSGGIIQQIGRRDDGKLFFIFLTPEVGQFLMRCYEKDQQEKLAGK